MSTYQFGQYAMLFLAPTGLVMATLQMLNMRYSHWFRFVWPVVISTPPPKINTKATTGHTNRNQCEYRMFNICSVAILSADWTCYGHTTNVKHAIFTLVPICMAGSCFCIDFRWRRM
jgi:hypothetical protein